MTKDTAEFQLFTDAVALVVSTLCQETKIHLNRKVASEGTPELGPYWKLHPVVCKVDTELRS